MVVNIAAADVAASGPHVIHLPRRDGWLSLFIAAVVSGDAAMVPILCMVVLPGWLAVARLPEMRITPPEGHRENDAATPARPA